MTVWDDVVGQPHVVAELSAAAADADALVTSGGTGSRMTHAWLFTGPPGSGRSTAARAFAAALQCVSPDRALGAAPGAASATAATRHWWHPRRREFVRTDLLSIGVKDTRDLVRARRCPLRAGAGRSSSWRTPTG